MSYSFCTLSVVLLLMSLMAMAKDGENKATNSDTIKVKDYNDYNYQVAGLSVTYYNPTLNDSVDILWDFGDGATSKKFYSKVNTKRKYENITHTYKAMGYYQTCMTMVHSETKEVLERKCKYIEILTPDLCEDWIWEPVCGCDNRTYFNACIAESFYDVYYWTEGECEQTIIDLEVGYAYEMLTEPDELMMAFINTSVGHHDTFIWDFGDGSFSDARNPKHPYTKEGTYNVCLTVISELTKEEGTRCEEVIVQQTPLAEEARD